jgi:hypothetical protein
MELSELKNQFTPFITGCGAFRKVNALADSGTTNPFAWWSYYADQSLELETLGL